MAGFCGMCGSARADGANFCMACGAKFAEEQRTCPTCGQRWPDEPASTPVNVPTMSATVEPPAGFAAVRGSYSSEHGPLYYDGTGWFRARELPGGIMLPDPSQPLPGFEPAGAGVTLVTAETGAGGGAVGMPRGPEVGPDYRPERDCGNCGFEIEPGVAPCPHCGSTNTGPVFTPGG